MKSFSDVVTWLKPRPRSHSRRRDSHVCVFQIGESTALLQTAMVVKAELFERLIADGNELDSKTFYSQSALFLATEYGDTDALERLWVAGFDVNFENMFGETALFVAAAQRDSDALLWLISHGCNVNHKSPEGETPLHLAAVTSARNVLLLLAAGAEVNAPKTNMVTPLMMAASSSCWEAVEALLEGGADVSMKTAAGGTALHEAIKSDNIRGALLLAQHHCTDLDNGGREIYFNYDGNDVTEDPPLLLSIQRGYPEIVEGLLEAGAAANVKDRCNNSALHTAIMNNQKRGADSELLQKSVDMDLSSIDTISADFTNDQTQIIASLLNHKADVNLRSADETTPLILAAMDKDSSWLVKSLIAHGADLDSADKVGNTALMYSALQVHVDSLKHLLEAGARVNASNLEDQTALYFAAIMKREEAVTLLLEHGALSNPVLHHVIRVDELRLVDLMVRNGSSPEESECVQLSMDLGITQPVTPLYLALFYGSLDSARLFAARGFLSWFDVTILPREPRLQRVLEQVYRGRFPRCLRSSLPMFDDRLRPKPCSLFILSFITVSTALGFSPGRQRRVEGTGLPALLQQSLLFRPVVTGDDGSL